MSFEFFIVDAFTSEPFKGNPAAVVILDENKSTPWMQTVAAEFNLSETAFLQKRIDSNWDLRWFTPTTEVNLCGHATLASAKALSSFVTPNVSHFIFHTLSGELTTRISDNKLTLNFPITSLATVEKDKDLEKIIGTKPLNCMLANNKLLVEVESEYVVRNFIPDLNAIMTLPYDGVFITAPSVKPSIDFVTRFFAPNNGINEDPVTGSIHCALAPYWSKKLSKNNLNSEQCSSRGGKLSLQLIDNRVEITGVAVVIAKGQFLQ